MKRDIHPTYRPIVFIDRATGDKILTRSTMETTTTTTYDGQEYPSHTVDVSCFSHPHWTGNNREIDTAGRLEKFRRRYGQGNAQ